MKKAILILFIFLSCYFIYNATTDNKLYYLNIGDGLAVGINNNQVISAGYGQRIKDRLILDDKLEGYNSSFTSSDYRITDINRAIIFHEKVYVNGDEFTINELLKKADIVTISVGMNELYYKLLMNNDNIYGYINDMLDDMRELLSNVKRFNDGEVFVLGYYNVTNSDYDVFTYLNYNLEKIVKDDKFIFIDLDKIFVNKDDFFKNNDVFYPNNDGYEKIFKIIVDKI